MLGLKRRGVVWLVAVGGALALVALFAPTLVNPGQMTRGHARLETQCFQCHLPFLGPSEAFCAECHPAQKIGRPGSVVAKFHDTPAAGDCLACHTDHQGPDPARATARFAHSLLTGELAADCRACHAQPSDTLHAKIKVGCAECHRATAWVPATLDHRPYFRFDRHHPADCRSCHTAQAFNTFTCYECHEHSPANVQRKHLKEGIRDFEPCAVCHRSGDEHEAKRLWRDLQRRGLTPTQAARSAGAQAPQGYAAPAGDRQPEPGRSMEKGDRKRREHDREEREDHEREGRREHDRR